MHIAKLHGAALVPMIKLLLLRAKPYAYWDQHLPQSAYQMPADMSEGYYHLQVLACSNGIISKKKKQTHFQNAFSINVLALL